VVSFFSSPKNQLIEYPPPLSLIRPEFARVSCQIWSKRIGLTLLILHSGSLPVLLSGANQWNSRVSATGHLPGMFPLTLTGSLLGLRITP